MEKKETKTVKKAESTQSKLTKAEEKSKATTLRIVSAVLWLVAIACEVLAILDITQALYLPGGQLLWAIIFIVLDLGCCIAASQLWKKASFLDPFKKTNNQFWFAVLNQLGVIMAAICFLPLIIVLFTDKNKLDKKSKIIVTVIAIVALLIAGLFGANFNPISAEEKEAAEATFTDTVYWSAFGHKYHLSDNCQAIRNSVTVYDGTVQDAIDAGRSELCAFCARDAEKAGTDLTGINVEETTVPVE
ncbi:MAG: hypothetical protein IJP98_02265 [Clostridia bacterium]|nr:hypothetical protein [Clostridia bacterium]